MESTLDLLLGNHIAYLDAGLSLSIINTCAINEIAARINSQLRKTINND